MGLKLVKNADQAAKYPLKDGGYYATDVGENGEIPESEWLGKLSASLGLSGAVRDHDYGLMVHGVLPDGTDLKKNGGKGKEERLPGADFTFSIPKSWSILAMEYPEIHRIHKEAVRAALTEFERFAHTRLTTNGQTRKVKTGNLAVAVFHHYTSRRDDMQIHSHGIILNMTMVNGKVRGLDSNTLLKLQGIATKVYYATLDKRLREAGFGIRNEQDAAGHVYPESTAINRDQVMVFSNGRKQILKYIEDHGLDEKKHAHRELANLKTRMRKSGKSWEELKPYWKEIAEKIAINFDAAKPSIPKGEEMKIDHAEKLVKDAKIGEAIQKRAEEIRPGWDRQGNGDPEFLTREVPEAEVNQTVLDDHAGPKKPVQEDEPPNLPAWAQQPDGFDSNQVNGKPSELHVSTHAPSALDADQAKDAPPELPAWAQDTQGQGSAQVSNDPTQSQNHVSDPGQDQSQQPSMSAPSTQAVVDSGDNGQQSVQQAQGNSAAVSTNPADPNQGSGQQPVQPAQGTPATNSSGASVSNPPGNSPEATAAFEAYKNELDRAKGYLDQAQVYEVFETMGLDGAKESSDKEARSLKAAGLVGFQRSADIRVSDDGKKVTVQGLNGFQEFRLANSSTPVVDLNGKSATGSKQSPYDEAANFSFGRIKDAKGKWTAIVTPKVTDGKAGGSLADLPTQNQDGSFTFRGESLKAGKTQSLDGGYSVQQLLKQDGSVATLAVSKDGALVGTAAIANDFAASKNAPGYGYNKILDQDGRAIGVLVSNNGSLSIGRQNEKGKIEHQVYAPPAMNADGSISYLGEKFKAGQTIELGKGLDNTTLSGQSGTGFRAQQLLRDDGSSAGWAVSYQGQFIGTAERIQQREMKVEKVLDGYSKKDGKNLTFTTEEGRTVSGAMGESQNIGGGFSAISMYDNNRGSFLGTAIAKDGKVHSFTQDRVVAADKRAPGNQIHKLVEGVSVLRGDQVKAFAENGARIEGTIKGVKGIGNGLAAATLHDQNGKFIGSVILKRGKPVEFSKKDLTRGQGEFDQAAGRVQDWYRRGDNFASRGIGYLAGAVIGGAVGTVAVALTFDSKQWGKETQIAGAVGRAGAGLASAATGAVLAAGSIVWEAAKFAKAAGGRLAKATRIASETIKETADKANPENREKREKTVAALQSNGYSEVGARLAVVSGTWQKEANRILDSAHSAADAHKATDARLQEAKQNRVSAGFMRESASRGFESAAAQIFVDMDKAGISDSAKLQLHDAVKKDRDQLMAGAKPIERDLFPDRSDGSGIAKINANTNDGKNLGKPSELVGELVRTGWGQDGRPYVVVETQQGEVQKAHRGLPAECKRAGAKIGDFVQIRFNQVKDSEDKVKPVHVDVIGPTKDSVSLPQPAFGASASVGLPSKDPKDSSVQPAVTPSSQRAAGHVDQGTIVDAGWKVHPDEARRAAAVGEKPKEQPYVTLKTDSGQTVTRSGVDLPRALHEAGAKIGDKIDLTFEGKKDVMVEQKVAMPDGKVENQTVAAERNVYKAEVKDSSQSTDKAAFTDADVSRADANSASKAAKQARSGAVGRGVRKNAQNIKAAAAGKTQQQKPKQQTQAQSQGVSR